MIITETIIFARLIFWYEAGEGPYEQKPKDKILRYMRDLVYIGIPLPVCLNRAWRIG